MINKHQLFRQAEDYFFTGISQQCLTFDQAAKAYMTGVPIADLNLVYVQNINHLDQILNQSKTFFDKAELSFVVIIPEELCVSEIENLLKGMNCVQTGKSVAMGISLSTNINEETIEIANDVSIHLNNHLDDWMMPLIGAFESTLEMASCYAKTHENALNRDLKFEHFCLYQKNQVISSITLSFHNGIARIDDVGTLPEFQGKGYATQLVKYVLSKAKKLGSTYCFLEASESGFSIYKKCGFEILFKNNIYTYSRQS